MIVVVDITSSKKQISACPPFSKNIRISGIKAVLLNPLTIYLTQTRVMVKVSFLPGGRKVSCFLPEIESFCIFLQKTQAYLFSFFTIKVVIRIPLKMSAIA